MEYKKHYDNDGKYYCRPGIDVIRLELTKDWDEVNCRKCLFKRDNDDILKPETSVKTESKFRIWAKKEYPGSFIKKLPDFKQMGFGCAIGLPDYIVIHDGNTIWYEVKSSFGNTLNIKHHFTPAQRIEFTKMIDSGAIILIAAFTKDYGMKLISFNQLLNDYAVSFNNLYTK